LGEKSAFEFPILARMAADVMGTPTILLARTDAQAGDLVAADIDDNDKHFRPPKAGPELVLGVAGGV